MKRLEEIYSCLVCVLLTWAVVVAGQPLIQGISKLPFPAPPGYMDGPMAVVGAGESVPMEVRMSGHEMEALVGVDVVFLVDNSGSMASTDPGRKRFLTIKQLASAFEQERNHLDRVGIVIFNGTSATLFQGWGTWSQTKAGAQDLYDSWGADGETPMADGMQVANGMFQDSHYYGLVILLSDGYPFPDDESLPQTETIVDTLIPEACSKRILYSTIYLYNPETGLPVDNSLLIDIARATDFITDYDIGDPPKYYFSVEAGSELASSYGALLGQIMERRAPENVRIRERIAAELMVDPDSPVLFYGTEFDPSRNVVGTSLDETIQIFKETGEFALDLNELVGDAVLEFSVMLNPTYLESLSYDPGLEYIVVNVNDSINSGVTYLHPDSMGNAIPTTLPFPQAQIKFLLGLFVTKQVGIGFDERTPVIINIKNVDLVDAQDVQVAEYPCEMVDAYEISDDFAFEPLSMIHEHRIIPWLLEKASEDPAVPSPVPGNVINMAKRLLRTAHGQFLDKKGELNPLLSQFWYHPWVSVDPKEYWYTQNQRGIYRLINLVPPLATKSIQFYVRDIGYLREEREDEWFSYPIDAVDDNELPRSKYRSSDTLWNTIEPNPLHIQLLAAQPKPDLYSHCCFSDENVPILRAVLQSEPSTGTPESYWNALDSDDLEVVWNPSIGKFGLETTIYNRGDAAAGSILRVKSYLLPFTGKELLPPYDISPPYLAEGVASLAPINPNQMRQKTILYHSLHKLGERPETVQVHPGWMQDIKFGIFVNLAYIDPADSELMLANNNAVEVVRLR